MNLQDCRYDIAVVMAGRRTGVHQRISEKNNLAIFVNCDNHSLNLVGGHAAKQDIIMVTFFGIIKSLCVFFSRSTLRWEKLKKSVPVVVKSESETRWSTRVEADPSMNFHNAALDIKSLQDYFSNEREGLVNHALVKGFNLCEEWDVVTEKRQRQKKTYGWRKRDRRWVDC
ncbi:hypothetical protein EVAR_63090_1 [Eumeta japonica]|uniref:Uncharacterized protein n=1 Tax=Eumeta variegata TaxID=151549 RepID=A0A4C1ZUQ8_EUMVA|nr:hypothetical protein EVAR_63090_1 [Eumeta japonica]